MTDLQQPFQPGTIGRPAALLMRYWRRVLLTFKWFAPPILVPVLFGIAYAPGCVAAESSMLPVVEWHGKWIGIVGDSKPNTWICYRRRIDLPRAPERAWARIACDSKYWLWINGKLVVFEGQLKRGPTPRDTYFDCVELTPHLHAGENVIAILVCHFGRHGFSHNSSGKAALLFDAKFDGQPIVSDESWKVHIHPAFGTTDPPLDNVRLPEANLRFDARHDLGPWEQSDYDDSTWETPIVLGRPPTAPWNQLYERPIPPWRDSGLRDYRNAAALPRKSNGQPVVAALPNNCQVTPYFKIDAPAGLVVGLATDVQDLYGKFRLVETHRHEYVTRSGVQEYELPQWMSGHSVHYSFPPAVQILDLKYRETGYDADFIGRFHCDDPALAQLWNESRRTLYVTMRDTFMDCPDRERAQWWGDAVNELGESFYVFDPQRGSLLTRKAIYELARWQRDDHSLYSPVPSGIRRPGNESPDDGSWNQELPQQMLASVGWYGFWTYYWYTGDRQTIVDAYPAVRRYLSLWKVEPNGLVVHRPGGWDWTDWGQNIDVPPIENAWYYLALKGAIAMAELTGNDADVAGYREKMRSVEAKFNEMFWQGDRYRSPSYQGSTDDRAQAMAVVAGLAGEDKYDAIAKVLEAERHASPYLEKYVLESLMLMHRPDLAVARMKCRYAAMLADKQTTLWECFEEMKLDGFGSLGHGTYNHAWSGGPLTVLSQYVAGIAPTRPAFEEFSVFPQLGPLKFVEALVPCKFGDIKATIRRDDACLFELKLDCPVGATAVVGVPLAALAEGTVVAVNGHLIGDERAASPPKVDRRVEQAGRDERFVRFRVPAGHWEFVADTRHGPADSPDE